MQSFKDFILEHYVTTDSPGEKTKYHDAIHGMMRQSYKEIGGYSGHGHDSPDESAAISADIHNPNHIIKIKKVGGTPVAAAIYKKSHGRKLIAAGTTGSDEGRHHIKKMLKDDVTEEGRGEKCLVQCWA